MEPLAFPLVSVAKKYLSAFSDQLLQLPIDRYQYVLVLIDDHPETLTQKALAELLHIDKSYMVIIMDYLAEKELIIREKNPIDRRQQLIRLTQKAKVQIPIIKAAICELNNKSFQHLTDYQIEIFKEVLRTIQNNLSDGIPSGIRLEYKKM